MPFVGRIFHRFDSSRIAWQGEICYALVLSLLPWTKSLTWLAFGTFTFGFGLANMVALIFGAAARRSPGGVGAAIAAAASVGYLGFLVGPPVVGSVSGVLGLRMALALVVVAGVVISFAARTVMAETRPQSMT
jgi:MFS family permease